MTDRNSKSRPGLDDLGLTRAERKALRDDEATEPVISSNGSHVPKNVHAGDIADRDGTAEWAGDDEQVDLPGPDQYSWGAAGGVYAQSTAGDVSSEVKLAGGLMEDEQVGREGQAARAHHDPVIKLSHVVMEEAEFQALPELDANPESNYLSFPIEDIFISSVTDDIDTADALCTNEVLPDGA